MVVYGQLLLIKRLKTETHLMEYKGYKIELNMGNYYTDDIRFDSIEEAMRYIDKRKKHLDDLKNAKRGRGNSNLR